LYFLPLAEKLSQSQKLSSKEESLLNNERLPLKSIRLTSKRRELPNALRSSNALNNMLLNTEKWNDL